MPSLMERHLQLSITRMIKAFAFLVYSLQFTVYSWSYFNWKLLLALLIPTYLFSQPTEYALVKTIPISATFLSSDKLGNGYVVNDKNELLKISPKGDTLYTYTNKSLGRISLVGTNNPLKILVYY